MRKVILSAIVAIVLAAPLAAQPSDQRQGPEPPPPLPPSPPGADSTAQRLTIPLSDPSRPGSLEIDIVTGNITVKGTNRRDVLIEARSTGNGRLPRRRTQERRLLPVCGA